MGCTPLKLPESVNSCSVGLIETGDQKLPLEGIEARWSDNPLERKMYIYEQGLPVVCDEFFEVERTYREMCNTISYGRKEERLTIGGVTIAYLEDYISTDYIGGLIPTVLGLQTLFPGYQNRFIDLTGCVSAVLGRSSIGLSIIEPGRAEAAFIYVHEFGHIVDIASWNDGDFKRLLLAAWTENNYLIVKDSTYIEPAKGQREQGHIENTSELFASTFRAYYKDADQFARFINNPSTPAGMKAFGMAMWSYMRENVFAGRVFTSDGKDPFSGFSYKSFLAGFNKSPFDVILEAFKKMDEFKSTMGILRFDRFINVIGVIDGLMEYLRMIAYDKRFELRYFLFSIMETESEYFIGKAGELLASYMPEEARLELLNILSLGMRVGSFARDVRPILEREAAGGTDKSRALASCLIKKY